MAARGARAQQPKVPTTGFIVAARPAAERDRIAAFSHRLRELGWIESRNIAIDFRSAEVRLKVDVIVIWEFPPGLFAAINVVGGPASASVNYFILSAKASRTIID